ncbi:MAG TPA: right-handed parallel beta-helix repeat-containing protein [Thermoanaerobaculia bacterium]|jgi:CSLREA domain-containing protein|nr:right-handed parallel beta-helix repeat-containing protein [Thermoanaerobaculia bacterium]
MMRRILSTFTAAAVCLAVWSAASAAQAAVFIPTKTTDSAGTCTPQDCSLREAILAANQNPGDDVILLHAGTYTLTIAGTGEDLGATGDLDVQGNLVLLGDGAASTVIDGGGLDRIFQVPDGVTVEIRDVTLRNGRAPGLGGAILNAGTLTLERSIVTGNSSVAGPEGPGFGGGLYSNGNHSSLTVTQSTIDDNSSKGGGGGLAAGGLLHLANVTLSNNHADSDFGGGLYIYGTAHAIINNVTVVDNSALRGGGLLVEDNAFIGIAPVISNSIIAGNTAKTSQPDCWGPVDSSYNLIGFADVTCNGPSPANHDVVGIGVPIPAKVGALQSVGGPTPVRPLAPGSPALDNGNPAPPGSGGRACEAIDQRGAARPGTFGAGSARCDIGAYEATTACVAGGPILCLSGSRFLVTASWKTAAGLTGSAQGVELTPDSGYFWFFDRANVELTLKVLNACSLNNRFWVFLSGLTDVEVTLTVTDTRTGTVKIYTNPQGQTFKTVLDTSAFGNCP